MGICLDTEQQRSGARGEDSSEEEDEDSSRAQSSTSNRRQPPGKDVRAAAHITFESPRVPVVFVIGGPGSGKVTHCDNVSLERPGLVHINMVDLLQQYAVGSGMSDLGELSSQTVTEVLMLEMKMASHAQGYLVSGFPRNMRDVVEYSDKIKVVSGVILVNWRRKVLERQVAYGAKLGHVVLRMARMELRYFYHHTTSVAEYFDQQGMLTVVDGERDPNEVYSEFRAVVNRIIDSEDPAGRVKGVTALDDADEFNAAREPHRSTLINVRDGQPLRTMAVSVETHHPSRMRYPPVIWVLGGPGSNKATLCQRALRKGGPVSADWIQLSLGRTFRAMALQNDSTIHASDKRSPIRLLPSSRTPSPSNAASHGHRASNKPHNLRSFLSSGEMVPMNDVETLLEHQMERAARDGVKGILIDGFPRDRNQLSSFETKYGQQPTLFLLDCSKLQLGRGRLDDSVPAFRRRLQLFRELTLPMLKILDQENRLVIVDGDTDFPSVQEEFCMAIIKQITQMSSGQPKRGDDRLIRQANGFAHGPSTKITPVTSFHAVRARDVLVDIETDVHEGESKNENRSHDTRNGVGIRGVTNGKQLANRERRSRMGNGIARALHQPPPYQPNYAMQDSYM